MKYTYLAFLFLFVLSACGSRNDKSGFTPEGQFSSTKIIAVLTNVQLLESLINTHGFFQNKEEQNLVFQEILDKHQITRQEFDSVLIYLETNLEVYQQILDSVKINLENMEKVDLPFLQERDTLNEMYKHLIKPKKLN